MTHDIPPSAHAAQLSAHSDGTVDGTADEVAAPREQPGENSGSAGPDRSERRAARLRVAAVTVLSGVAVAGAVLSFASLYEAAVPLFGPVLAAGFPLLVDALCLGASLAYAAGATIGRPRAGWRLTAHAAAAGTVVLNALAARHLTDVPWHVTAPVTWSVLVELSGRELLGAWRATHDTTDRIPARLWATAPVESARTWLLMARTGVTAHATGRVDVGVHAAAVEALRLTLPGHRSRKVRAVLRRQLRAGSLPPAAILTAVGWDHPTPGAATGTPTRPAPAPSAQDVLRVALRGVLAARPDARTVIRPEVSSLAGQGTASTPAAGTPAVGGRRTGASAPGPVAVAGTPRALPRPAAAVRESRPRATAPVDRGSVASDEDILASLTADPAAEPPSIRSLMRTHGIGQTRATRIHRAASNRAHKPASGNPTEKNQEPKSEDDQNTSDTPESTSERDHVESNPEDQPTKIQSPSQETPGIQSRNHTLASPTE